MAFKSPTDATASTSIQTPELKAEGDAVTQEQPAPASLVNVIDPDSGELGSLPHDQLEDAVGQGYRTATPDEVTNHFNKEQYGTPGQQAMSVGEGILQGVAGPLATATEEMAGADPKNIAGRQETNPGENMIGQGIGLAAPALLAPESLAAKATLGGIMSAAGEGAGEIAGQAIARPGLAKLGSNVVKLAVENSVFAASDESSKMLLHPEANPADAVETAAANIGMAALLGGAIGVPYSAVSPLWQAASKSQLGGMLSRVAKRVGGVEGVQAGPMDHVLGSLGIDVPPEVRATLSSDPELQRMARVLEQTDTAKAGKDFQQTLGTFRNQLGESMVKTMGKDPADLEHFELSNYESGKKLGSTLADEYDAKVDPHKDVMEDYRKKYGQTPLEASVADKVDDVDAGTDKISAKIEKANKFLARAIKNNDVESAVNLQGQIEDLQKNMDDLHSWGSAPGSTDHMLDQVAHTAQIQGWASSPESPIMQKVNQVLRELPYQKSLKDLTSYISQVDTNFPWNPLDKSVSRAGQIVKQVLRNEEERVMMARVGAEEGQDAMARFRDAQAGYRQVADLKDQINDRLKIKSSVSGYGGALREAASTDGESVIRKLSGKGDADLLQLLDKNFPRSAQALREYHVDSMIDSAVRKAKDGQILSSSHLTGAVNKMSPELRSFVLNPEQASKVDAVSQVLDKLNSPHYNFSNTGRTLDKLMEYVPSSALGLLSLMSGHNPMSALLIGGLTKILGHEAPAAARLAFLKFMGREGTHIDAEGFKQMADFMRSTSRGEALTARAVKNVFKEGEVIPAAAMPKEADKAKLDKALKAIQTSPESQLESPLGSAQSYMPEHAGAMGEFTQNAINYLNGLRPNTTPGLPLDTKRIVSPVEKAAFDRALGIAQQPLIVLDRIKKGNITVKDVEAVRTMYPSLYNRLSQKLTNEMTEAINKGDPISYKLRVGMSMFLGQPLDSTMTPQAILAAQPPATPPQQQTAQGLTKKGSTALSKTAQNAETQGQGAERRRNPVK